MGTETKVGHIGQVKIGSNAVLGMGKWSFTQPEKAKLDDTEFADVQDHNKDGRMGFGSVTFSGLARPGDTTGQQALAAAYAQGTDMTDLRFYIDNTSYYVPSQTSGYLDPTNSSGMGNTPGNINIKSFTVDKDKNGMMNVSFTGELTGFMALV